MADTDATTDIVEESTPAASSREPTLSAPTVSVAAPVPSRSDTMSNNGWVKEHRKLLDWPLFKKPLTAHLWEYCRLRANHAAVDLWAGGEQLHLEPGQFIIGRHAACEDTGLTDKQYRVAMLHLENAKCLNRANHRANQFSIVTICNWGRYQHGEDAEGQPKGQAGANQGPTKGQAGATDKNEKKNKKEKNEKKQIEISREFADWWELYPKCERKVGRAGCVKRWVELELDWLIDDVKAAIACDKASTQWQDPKFIPLPLSWLNKKRWLDDLTDSPANKPPVDELWPYEPPTSAQVDAEAALLGIADWKPAT